MLPETPSPKKKPASLVATDFRSGHRQRLRERFLRGGTGALQEYELLELILFRAIPRRDVKDLAKHLLKAFGGFGDVVNASPQRLREFSGISDAAICELKLVAAAATHLSRARIINQPAASSFEALLDYCRSDMAYNTIEQFRILFLNRKNIIIADEKQQQGTVDHTPVYPREVVKRALELGASALILVHNHPSGDPTPSQADIDMTQQIATASEALGIVVHEHIIIGKKRHFSFRRKGLL